MPRADSARAAAALRAHLLHAERLLQLVAVRGRAARARRPAGRADAAAVLCGARRQGGGRAGGLRAGPVHGLLQGEPARDHEEEPGHARRRGGEGARRGVEGALRGREGQVRRHWLLHLVFAVPIIGLVMASPYVTVTSYILYSVIPSLALLSVRSYIEHRSSHYSAHDTVLIEAGWLWRLLFLNNNYHVIHHDLPHLRWYQIHETFTAQKQAWLARAGDYHFSGYGAVFRRFFFSVPAWLRPPVFITKARHKDVG